MCHRTLIPSFDLDYGTIMMDACCTCDVILQRIHLVSSSSVAVNSESNMSEAHQILQPKDQATIPILELAASQLIVRAFGALAWLPAQILTLPQTNSGM